MTAVAETAIEDFFTHHVPGTRDIDPDKNNCNHLAGRIFNRLILGDVALAKQQCQTAIDFAFAHGAKRGTGIIQHGADSAFTVFFAQRCGHTNKIITAADKQS
ncbi:hypothetical protein D3C78_705490 [compost metagenome]